MTRYKKRKKHHQTFIYSLSHTHTLIRTVTHIDSHPHLHTHTQIHLQTNTGLQITKTRILVQIYTSHILEGCLILTYKEHHKITTSHAFVDGSIKF